MGAACLAQLRSGRDPEKASNWPPASLESRVIGSNRGPRTSWPASPFLPEPDPASGGLPSTRVRVGTRGGGGDGWSGSVPDGFLGGLAGLCRVVGQDTRLPALTGAGASPGSLALRSGLHRVGPARRVGVAARRQLRVSGLGRPRAARLLHPGDAEQAQGEAQGDAHGHRPRGPQHGQQQRRPHGVPTAGPRPPRSPRRLRGGGTGEGADPEGPGPAGGPAPSPPSRASSESRNPRAAPLPLQLRSASRASQAAAVRRVKRGPRPRGGVSAVSDRRGMEGEEVKGEGPPEVPPPQRRRGRRRGRSPPASLGVVGASRVTSDATRPCLDGAP